MDNEKALDWIVGLDDADFKELVSQSMKARTTEPEKWRLLLDSRVVDATRDVLVEFITDAERQMRDPGKYPQAGHFHKRMRGFLMDLDFTLILRGDTDGR